MKMRKKVFSFLLAVLLTASVALTACGKRGSTSESDTRAKVYTAYDENEGVIGKYASMYEAIDVVMTESSAGAYVTKNDETDEPVVFTNDSDLENGTYYNYVGSSLHQKYDGISANQGYVAAQNWTFDVQGGASVNGKSGQLAYAGGTRYAGDVEMATWNRYAFRGANAEQRLLLFSGYNQILRTVKLSEARIKPSLNKNQPTRAEIYFIAGDSYIMAVSGVYCDPADGNWYLFTKQVSDENEEFTKGALVAKSTLTGSEYRPQADLSFDFKITEGKSTLKVKNLSDNTEKSIDFESTNIHSNSTPFTGVTYSIDYKTKNRTTMDIMNGGYFKNIVVTNTTYKTVALGEDYGGQTDGAGYYTGKTFENVRFDDSVSATGEKLVDWNYIYRNDNASYEKKSGADVFNIYYDNQPASANASQAVKDRVAADATIKAIKAIPSYASLTKGSQNVVTAANAAYTGLTAAQKLLVPTELVSKLFGSIDRVGYFSTSRYVDEIINAFPMPEAGALPDEAGVGTLRAAYDALTEEERDKVYSLMVEKLELLEAIIASVVVEEILATVPAVADINNENLEDNQELLKSIWKRYYSFNLVLRNYINDDFSIVFAAQAKVDELLGEKVAGEINALTATSTAEEIKAVYNAYINLSSAAKTSISQSTVNKLETFVGEKVEVRRYEVTIASRGVQKKYYSNPFAAICDVLANGAAGTTIDNATDFVLDTQNGNQKIFAKINGTNKIFLYKNNTFVKIVDWATTLYADINTNKADTDYEAGGFIAVHSNLGIQAISKSVRITGDPVETVDNRTYIKSSAAAPFTNIQWNRHDDRGTYFEHVNYNQFNRITQTWNLSESRIRANDPEINVEIYFGLHLGAHKAHLGIYMDKATGEWRFFNSVLKTGVNPDSTSDPKANYPSSGYVLYDTYNRLSGANDPVIMTSTKDAMGVWTPSADLEFEYIMETGKLTLNVRNIMTAKTYTITYSHADMAFGAGTAAESWHSRYGVMFSRFVKSDLDTGYYAPDGDFFKNIIISESNAYIGDTEYTYGFSAPTGWNYTSFLRGPATHEFNEDIGNIFNFDYANLKVLG